MKKHLVLAACLLTVGAGVAIAQNAGSYDPAQLPATKGTVAEYSLSPRGQVDGLILTDGTEVHLPPHLGTQLVFAVKPGDAVTVHGLRALAIPMVQAMSISNDATGKTVADTGPAGPPGKPGGEQQMTASGRIKLVLHGPRGDLNGALLEDGTIIRMPPPEATRLAAQLTPGSPLAVQGVGYQGDLGRVIGATAIGPSMTQLVQLAAPPPPRGRPAPPAGDTEMRPAPPPRG